MAECVVCGDTEFTEEGGLFYCTTCNTQSQGMQVMMVDEDENPATFTGISNLIHEKKGDNIASRKKEVDYGRPWSIYEAYQIILLKQTEALVKLGAHPQLKDIVFRIWVKYLSKLGVAFSNQPVNKTLASSTRQREMFPPTTKTPMVKNVLTRRSRRKTVGPSARKSKKLTDKDVLEKAFADEEFYEGDNPFSKEQQEGSGSSSSSSEEEEEDVERWGKSRKHLDSYSVYRMQLRYTLAFCYMGLMYTNPVTTVTDLIRWVQLWKVPYKQASKLLPDEMKFCLHDWQLFRDIVPSSQLLRKLIGSLTYFLCLRDFPNFPLQQLISKYIIQMDLPASLHTYAINICDLLDLPTCYQPILSCKKLPFWEGMAISCITIALRSFLGLNNRSERLFSMYSREIIKLIDNRHQLFVYDDWVLHLRNKLYIEQLRKTGQNHADDVEENVPENMLDCRRRKRFKRWVRIGLLRPFLSLEQHLKTRQEAALEQHRENPGHSLQNRDRMGVNQSVNPGTQLSDLPDFEFNLESNTQMEEDPVGFLLSHFEGEGETGSREGETYKENTARFEKYLIERLAKLHTEGEKFRKSSFQHLVFPETYLETLDRHGLMEATINSTTASVSEWDGTVDLESIHETDHEDEETSHPEAQAEDRVRSSLRRYIEENIQTGQRKTKIHNMERYKIVIEHLKYVRENFLLTLDEEMTNDCSAYSQLMDIFSQVLDCDLAELRDEVRKQEVRLLGESTDLKKNYKLIKFNKNYHYAAKRVKKF